MSFHLKISNFDLSKTIGKREYFSDFRFSILKQKTTEESEICTIDVKKSEEGVIVMLDKENMENCIMPNKLKVGESNLFCANKEIAITYLNPLGDLMLISIIYK